MSAPARVATRATLLCLLAVACYTSVPPEKFAPAVGPRGAVGQLTLARGPRRYVELLELRDSAFVLLVGDRVAIAPFRVVRGLALAQIGDVTFPFEPPRPSARQQLRMASRFPHGMPAPALAELLAASGQPAPDDLSAPGTP